MAAPNVSPHPPLAAGARAPALGVEPLATSAQDALALAVCFAIAGTLLPWPRSR
jgi:hypothetical protein